MTELEDAMLSSKTGDTCAMESGPCNETLERIALVKHCASATQSELANKVNCSFTLLASVAKA